jgi:hypothetical protein
MSPLRARWPVRGLMAAFCALIVWGCAVTDVGYAPGYDAGWPGYYEPTGGLYGGWGPGFQVGPYYGGGIFRRGGGGGPAWRGGDGGHHAYRAAPGSQPMPTIPSGGRGGAGRRR